MVFNSETAVAILRMLMPIIACIASTVGWAYDADMWTNIALSALTVVLFIYTWWKNNNITEAAQEAQKLLDEIKEKTGREGTE